MTQPFASAATLNSSIDSDKFFNDEKVYNKNICVANFFLQAHTHTHTRRDFQFILSTPYARSQIIESIFISSEFSSLNDNMSKLFIGIPSEKRIRIDKVFTNGFLS